MEVTGQQKRLSWLHGYILIDCPRLKLPVFRVMKKIKEHNREIC